MSLLIFDPESDDITSLYSCSSNTSISSLALIPASKPSLLSPVSTNKGDTSYPNYESVDDIFYYFNSLPLSIRVRIWEHFLPGERIISHSHEAYSPLPKPLSQICRQTRYIVLSRFRPLFKDWDWQYFESKVYLAPQHDTLLIDVYEKSLSDSLQTISEITILHLHSIALRGWEIMFDTRSRTPWLQLECLLQIPNLCKLNLVYVSVKDHVEQELTMLPAFTMVTSEWPDELEEEDVDMLVRYEVVGCCQALKFDNLKGLKAKVKKIGEVLEMYKAMSPEWRMPRVKVRVLVGTLRQARRVVDIPVDVPQKKSENWCGSDWMHVGTEIWSH